MKPTLSFPPRRMVFPFLLLITVILMASSAQAQQAAPEAPLAPQAPQASSVPLLQFQGRLLDPVTGQPKPDGTYKMIFSIYDSVGTQLWYEKPSVAVRGGLYNVYLGSQVGLGTVFDSGEDRWLGIAVESDTEATPRIQIGHVPYAMQADLAGNSLLLNGQPASSYARSVHTHSAADIRSGNLNTDVYSAYADLVAESKIGSVSGQVAAGDHVHDSRYYTQAASDSRFLNNGGGTMTGDLTVPRVVYSHPRLHVTSVSSEAFFPTTDMPYANGGGQGGAWKPAGAGGVMAAALQLPDGATVTKFGVYFYDNSAQNLSISLDLQGLMWGGYSTLASVTTGTASTVYQYLETTSISSPVIDNEHNGYLIWVFPLNTWDDINLRIKGAVIYYTLTEAP